MKKLLLPFLFFITINICWSQNNAVPIIYGVNLAPNNPAPESDKIADYISLVKTKSKIQKAQNEFYRLEQNYLAGINYGLKNVDLYDNYFKTFYPYERYFSFVKDKKSTQNYMEMVKDSLFCNWKIGGFYKSLYKNKVIYDEEYIEFDEYGDEIFGRKEEFKNIYEVVSSIRFSEEWAISTSGNFNKLIIGYQLGYPALDDGGGYKGERLLPMVLMNKELKNENHFKTVEYDVIFSDPSVTEVQEYISSGYYHNIYPNDKSTLLRPIIEGVIAGNIDMYYPDKYNEKGNPIKVKQDSSKTNLTCIKSTLYIEDEWGEPVVPTEIVDLYSSIDIVGFRFLEDWYIDELTNSFKKKVKYYAPMVSVYNEMGEVKDTKILFWVKN